MLVRPNTSSLSSFANLSPLSPSNSCYNKTEHMVILDKLNITWKNAKHSNGTYHS